MKTLSILKWVLPVVVLIAAGTYLVRYGSDQEAKFLKGYRLYNAASAQYDAAIAASKDGDLEAAAWYMQNAYTLYVQSFFALDTPDAKALALYETANTGWEGQIADYRTLVGLYQESLRNKPGFYESAFNLELLYWLKDNESGKLPVPLQQEGPEDQQGPQPGSKPGVGGGPSSGDI